MSTTNRYREIERETREADLTKFDCFAAFNKKQFEEGMASVRPLNKGEKFVSIGCGVFGTRDGIERLFKFHEQQHKKIANECHPQDVYDAALADNECHLAYGGDEEAIKYIVAIYGEEVARTVKRKYACVSIDELDKE